MGGTKLGGQRAKATVLDTYGTDYYQRIGSLGGKKSKTGGFGSNKVGKDGLTGKQRAKVAGVVGGKAPKHRKKKTN